MPKKATPSKKQKTSRSRAKKPKVKLAKNKVALFCGAVCGICVLAIGLSIAINSKTELQKAEVQQNHQPELTQVQPKTQTQPKAQAQQTQKIESQPVKQKTTDSQKTQQTSVKNEKKVEAKQEKQAEIKQSTKNSQQIVITKENKLSSNVKTVSSSQTSQAGTMRSQPQKTSGQQKSVQKTESQIASVMPPKEQDTIQQNVPRNRFDIPPASNGATVVIIIDDAGRSVENTKRYASLPFPITIAVLPKLPQTRACADAIRAAGKEVILHQPMQSTNLNLDPGPGKITADMSTYQIAQIVKQNLMELGPGVKGMNNHEGSLITSNVIKIGAVLEVCNEMGVYFLDSRTTAATQAPQAALERDMRIFEKAGPYLDNDIDRAKMLERMRETLAYANRHGRAIVIGHVDKSVKILPDLLAEMYPEMKAAGYRFATPSQLR